MKIYPDKILKKLSSLKKLLFQRETIFCFLMLSSSSHVARKLDKMNSKPQNQEVIGLQYINPEALNQKDCKSDLKIELTDVILYLQRPLPN